MTPFWPGPAPHPPGITHLVGGAVRDEMLNLPVTERDWVVTGSTPERMAAAGFRPVGKDFPVFLHPVTGEEYALARTERKTGHGYGGFSFHADPEVTLEQDLARRDLSINAMARSAAGELIDPYGGAADIQAKCLRHVSSHFAEDPLRVLRTARFQARFQPLGFTLADETLALMQQISASGELPHLSMERCWKETEKALLSAAPAEYFRTLRACHALVVLFPEIDALFGVPQTARYHPEIDTGIHTLLALEQACRLSDSLEVRFATLCHDFGKARTPKIVLPGHHGHEKRGVPIIEAFCQRLKTPRALKEIAQAVAEFHLLCHKTRELRPETLLKLFERLDAFRRPQRLEVFLLACEADARGRTGLEDQPYPQARYLQQACAAALRVKPSDLVAQGHQGAALGRELRAARLRQLDRHRKTYQNSTSSIAPSTSR